MSGVFSHSSRKLRQPNFMYGESLVVFSVIISRILPYCLFFHNAISASLLSAKFRPPFCSALDSCLLKYFIKIFFPRDLSGRKINFFSTFFWTHLIFFSAALANCAKFISKTPPACVLIKSGCVTICCVTTITGTPNFRYSSSLFTAKGV